MPVKRLVLLPCVAPERAQAPAAVQEREEVVAARWISQVLMPLIMASNALLRVGRLFLCVLATGCPLQTVLVIWP